jgi:hypothetical protein
MPGYLLLYADWTINFIPNARCQTHVIAYLFFSFFFFFFVFILRPASPSIPPGRGKQRHRRPRYGRLLPEARRRLCGLPRNRIQFGKAGDGRPPRLPCRYACDWQRIMRLHA